MGNSTEREKGVWLGGADYPDAFAETLDGYFENWALENLIENLLAAPKVLRVESGAVAFIQPEIFEFLTEKDIDKVSSVLHLPDCDRYSRWRQIYYRFNLCLFQEKDAYLRQLHNHPRQNPADPNWGRVGDRMSAGGDIDDCLEAAEIIEPLDPAYAEILAQYAGLLRFQLLPQNISKITRRTTTLPVLVILLANTYLLENEKTQWAKDELVRRENRKKGLADGKRAESALRKVMSFIQRGQTETEREATSALLEGAFDREVKLLADIDQHEKDLHSQYLPNSGAHIGTVLASTYRTLASIEALLIPENGPRTARQIAFKLFYLIGLNISDEAYGKYLRKKNG